MGQGYAEDKAKDQDGSNACQFSNGAGFSPPQCDHAEPNVNQQCNDLYGEPVVLKGVLRQQPCQADSRCQQNGINDVRAYTYPPGSQQMVICPHPVEANTEKTQRHHHASDVQTVHGQVKVHDVSGD